MKLKLNNHIISDIIALPLEEAEEEVKTFVNDLEKLYNLDSLSDEELKNIIREYYTFNIYNSYEELERVSKSILKANVVKGQNVPTNIRGPLWYSTNFIDAKIWQDSKREFKEYYTLEELEKLVRDRKIVIESFNFSKRKIAIDDTSVFNTSLNPLINIGDKDFGTYEDIILSKVRKKLQKTKVYRDIMRIINIMRTRLHIEQYNLTKERVELQRQKNLIEQNLATNSSHNKYYNECLEDLDKLTR